MRRRTDRGARARRWSAPLVGLVPLSIALVGCRESAPPRLPPEARPAAPDAGSRASPPRDAGALAVPSARAALDTLTVWIESNDDLFVLPGDDGAFVYGRGGSAIVSGDSARIASGRPTTKLDSLDEHDASYRYFGRWPDRAHLSREHSSSECGCSCPSFLSTWKNDHWEPVALNSHKAPCGGGTSLT